MIKMEQVTEYDPEKEIGHLLETNNISIVQSDCEYQKIKSLGKLKLLHLKLLEFVDSKKEKDVLLVDEFIGLKVRRDNLEKKKLKEGAGKKSERLRDQEWAQEKFNQSITSFVNKLDMAKQFILKTPLYYDRAKIWWVWNHVEKKWFRGDETDIMILVSRAVPFVDTVNSKEKNEIIEALKQVARQNEPKPIDYSWVQFKDKLVNVLTGEIREATPEYFIMNPFPWDLGNSEDTPFIDNLFKEWVGEKWIPTMYEIMAFCLIPKYFIHRVFCFLGRGRNGKTTYMNLLINFLGKSNCCSSSLSLILKSRFESIKLYKKNACIMGETNFTELTDDDIFKKMTGSDPVGFEIKGKDPFDEYNYAKILIATNALPETLDKTDGFYSRWLIIDFPNQFGEGRDVIAEIPEQEYRNLARKCLGIAKRLILERKFTNEGTILERARRYEDKSNPLQKFLDEMTYKNPDGYVYKYQFKEEFLKWLAERGYRVWNDKEIGKKMTEKFEDGQRGEKSYRAWLGISLKLSEQNEDKITPYTGYTGYPLLAPIYVTTTHLPVYPVYPVSKDKNTLNRTFEQNNTNIKSDLEPVKCSNCQNPLKNGEFEQRNDRFFCLACLKIYDQAKMLTNNH